MYRGLELQDTRNLKHPILRSGLQEVTPYVTLMHAAHGILKAIFGERIHVYVSYDLSTNMKVRWQGSDEGKDIYDSIEYLASLPWCNDSVTMAGNSWLGISQWFAAAERPPHLKCIAPLEGASDIYRDIIAPGGVPNIPLQEMVQKNICGQLNIFMTHICIQGLTLSQ